MSPVRRLRVACATRTVVATLLIGMLGVVFTLGWDVGSVVFGHEAAY